MGLPLFAIGLFVFGSDPCADIEYSVGITALTDVLTPVPLNRVMVAQGSQRRTFLTDWTGSTPTFGVGPETPLTLTLKQKSTPSGITIGQVLTYAVPTASAELDALHHFLVLFQPVMEPALLDSSNPRPVQSRNHDRWYLLPKEGASFNASVNIGMLMTPREIVALESYYGFPLAHDDYRMGLAIWAGDPEDLGDVGARLLLRFDSYSFSGAPAVDRYFIATSPDDLGSADFEAVPSGWDGSVERADYDLSGRLGKGLNLLLFREGSPGDLSEFVAMTPAFVPPASEPLVLAQELRCDPPTPAPSGGESCDISTPLSDPGCARGDCIGPPFCTTTFQKAGGRWCAGGGGHPEEKKVGITTTISGGLSPKVTVVGVEITPSAGASKSASEIVTALAGTGTGCGQCVQVWKEVVICTTPCIIEKNTGHTLSGGILCLDAYAPGQCIDTSNSDTTHCDMTGC